MFNRVEINGLRGIKTGVLENLAQVNLFIGPNGSGKSTVLEALNLLAAGYSSNDGLGANRVQQDADRRNEVVFADGWWFSREVTQPIVLTALLGEQLLKASIVRNGSQEGSGGFQLDPQPYGPVTTRKQGLGTILSFLNKTLFIDAQRALDKNIEQKLWGKVFMAGNHAELIELFQSIYNLKVRNVTFVNNELLVDTLPRPLRLDDLGAGMRISFRVLLAESASAGSALLLEEFDAYQHKIGLQKLADAICKIAKRLQVQLFMTTHSLESVHAFVAASEQQPDTLVKVFPLSLSVDGTLKTHGIPAHDALDMLKAGLDLREITSYAK